MTGMWRGASNEETGPVSAEKPLRLTLAEITGRVSSLVPPEKLEPPERAIDDLRASGITERILRVGATAPDFELVDQRGQVVRSADLLVRGPLIVVFFRGRWCPYCVATLEAWQARLPQVQAAGASLVAISPQKPLHTSFTAEQHKLTFPVLSDTGNAVARQFGLAYRVPDYLERHYRGIFINLPNSNGDPSWELPLAATFVIAGKDAGEVARVRTVRFAYASPDFKDRAEPADVLRAAGQS
ncbi:MAG TPA: peroxiredoxin-like family protein [Terriglobales bacterium]|nr:peroxiredoxin-like family protein [Terriglobales bacterium]